MSTIKTIWLKNTKNGLIFNLAEQDRFLYSETCFVEANKDEVQAWQDGVYWSNIEAKTESELDKSTSQPKSK